MIAAMIILLGSADMARADVETWRTKVVSWYANQMGTVWKDLPTLPSGFDSYAKSVDLKSRFAPTLDGLNISNMGRLVDNPSGVLHGLELNGPDNVSYVFATWNIAAIQRPLLLAAHGFAHQKETTAQDSRTFVSENIIGKSTSSSVVGFDRLMPLETLEVKGAYSGKSYFGPFDSGWLFFVDDRPGANWAHPCRYVFVSADLSAYAVWYSNEPCVVFDGENRLDLDTTPPPISASKTGVNGFASFVKSVHASNAANFSNSLDFGKGDASRTYAVIISGGGNPKQNYSRYWGDVAMIYSTLRNQYAIPKDNIRVCVSSGNNSDKDMLIVSSGVYQSSPQDLDGDGITDISDSAAKNQIKTVFSALASTLTVDDQLFVFITDHGSQNADTGICYLIPWLGSSEPTSDTCISSSEFASYIKDIAAPTVIAMEFCFSGAFVDDIAKQPNRVVATACGVEVSSAWSVSPYDDAELSMRIDGPFDYCNPWAWAFNSAIRGADSLWGWNPWNNDSGVSLVGDADTNGDGMVSMYEASQLAKSYVEIFYLTVNDESRGIYNERWTFCDSPQYGESSNGLGSRMFVLNQAAPAIPTIPSAPSPYLDNTTSTTLKWSAVSGAKYYRVYRSENPFSDPQPYSGWITSTSASIASPSSRSTVYYYWVKAASQADEKAASGFSAKVRKSTDTEYDVVQEDSASSVNKTLSDSKLLLTGRNIEFSILHGDTSEASCALTIKGSSIALGSTYYGPTSGFSMSDTASVRYTWTANSSTTPRHAYYRADCSSSSLTGNLKMGGGIYNDHHFFQSGQIALSGGSSQISATADCKAYTVNVICTPVTTAWTASADKPWVALYRTSSTGSGVLGFVVDENTGAARSATITLKVGSTTYATVAVNQAAGAAASVKVTVSFVSNGGTSCTNCEYTVGSTYGSLPTTSKTGYTFAGWWTSSSGGTQITASSTVSSSTIRTLYAHWTPITYNINYSLGDGGTHGATHPSSMSYDEVFYVSAPSKSGYTFTGWTVTSGLNTGTAKWGTYSSPANVIASASTVCANGENGDVWFLNLRAEVGTVTLTANWVEASVPDIENFDIGFYRRNTIPRSLYLGIDSSSIPEETHRVPVTSGDDEKAPYLIWCVANLGQNNPVESFPFKITILDASDSTVHVEPVLEHPLPSAGYNSLRNGYWLGPEIRALGPGNYRICATLDPDDTLGDTNRADNVQSFRFSVLPETAMPLANALGCANLSFIVQADSDAPFGQSFDGNPCLQFGPQCHSTTNSLIASVSGAGTLTFQWKASCENGYDWMDLFSDGAIVDSISGISSAWRDVSVDLADGNHEVKWCYSKDGSVDGGLDAVFIRNVSWTPVSAIEVGKPAVSASGDSDYVQLLWDPADNASGYAVWRATSASGTKQRVQVPIGTMNTIDYIDGVGTYVQRFFAQDTTAVPGVDYWYWVVATNGTALTFSDSVSEYRRVSLSVTKNGSSFTTLPFGAEAASDQVTVIANTSWTAWSTGNGWPTLSPSEADGSATMSVSVPANLKTSTKMANISIEAGEGTAHSVVVNFIVYQDAPPQPKTITVTFDANGGTGTMTAQTFQEGESKYLSANAFAKSGCHFIGWSKSPDAVEPTYADGELLAPSADVILYAVWRSNKHAVEFHANGGTGTMKAQTFTWNVEKELSACAFIKEYYDFSGWATNETGGVIYADGQSIQIDEDLDLWAVWTPKTFTVTFNGNGATGGAMAAQSFTYGVAKDLSANAFQKTGQDFKGWATTQGGAVVYADGAQFSATANITLWAVWEAKTYHVTFNGNGATSGAMASQSFTYGVAMNLNVNAFQKTGHDFKGWAAAPGGVVVYADGAQFSATANVTLWAVWEPKTFMVTFNGNGATGGAMAAQSFTYGVAKNLNANAFQKTGHDFKGWATTQGGAVVYADGAQFSATANITLWAVWEAKTYHVTFNGNGATSGAMAAQSFTYGVAKNLSANAFQKTGHDFKGWATAQGGAVLYADGAQFSASADVTLWAVWEPKTFTIRFLMNDGTATVLGSQQFTYGVSAQLDAPMPTREGYTLAGWAETANGGVAYVGGETVTFEDDTDLYAVWSAGLGAALAGTESLVWRTGGDAPWTGVLLDGEDVARSGAISDYGFTYVATDVTGPGRLMFRWKVSSESYRDYQIDYLTFSVDDEEMDWIGGEVGWTECTFDLNEGPHTLTWTYFKDEVDFDGEDCAWLDSVFFLHSSGVSFAAPDATSGSVPSAIEGWENDEVMLPAAGDLRRAKHEFAGWTDGIATYSPGGAYILPPAAATLSAVWTAKVVATPEIDALANFTNETASASIACATPGATIRYTLDGSDPLGTTGVAYNGPFAVAGCPMILAAATLDDWFDSAVATASVSRVWTAAEVLNAPDRFFDFRSDVPWTRDLTVSHDGTASMRSGAIGDGESTAFSTVVYGSGTVSFWWKVSSEIFKNHKIDYLSFMVDGTEAAWTGGEKGWAQCSAQVSGDGTHTLSWVYSKDSEGSAGDDACWVDEFVWTPDTASYVMVDAGNGENVAVERAWLEEKFPGVPVSTASAGLAANGKPVWHAYVAGYDPTDPNADFRAEIRIVNGIPVVEPDPNLGETRTYVIEGKPTLDDTWGEPDGDSRFFRIRVLPPDVSNTGGNASAALAAPTGVAATNDREDGVLVSWQAVSGATSYELWKGMSGTPDPTALVGSGVETYRLDAGVAPGIQSRYWVRALNASSSSALSVPVEGMKRLAAPKNVTAISSGDPVALSWDAVTGASSYEVWRAQTDDVSSAEKLGDTVETSYSDNSLSRGLNYWYWVKPMLGDVQGSMSSSAKGWRSLERPTGVTASQGTEAAGVRVTWNVVEGAVLYNVLRSSNANEYVKVGTTSSTSFLDSSTGLSDTWYSDTWYYVVEAVGRDVGSVGCSSYAWGYQGIVAPEEVSATQGEDFGAVIVSWSAVDGASRYSIWRSTSSSSSSSTCISSYQTGNAYRDTTATGGTNYYYWVKASTSMGAISEFSSRALGYNAEISSLVINGVSALYGVGAQGCYGAMAKSQSGKVLPLPASATWELVTTGYVKKVTMPSGLAGADIISDNKTACFAVTNIPASNITLPSGQTISLGNRSTTIKASCAWHGVTKSVTKAITISTADSSTQYSSYIAGTNSAIVLGGYSGTASSVTVPTTFNGGTVKGLNGSFKNTSVSSVTIPTSVTSISSDTFAPCTSLATITVNQSNPKLSSENGILFNKEKTTLLRYPPAKSGSSYAIPDSVTSLGANSLSGLAYLTSIYVPPRVTSFPVLGSTSLRQIYFFGNRPSTSSSINGIGTSSGTVYYLQDSTGWGDIFGKGFISGGIPTTVWSNPVKSLAISGVNSIASGNGAAFRGTATFQSGHAYTYDGIIVWSITSGSGYASITSAGNLVAKSVTSPQTVTIKATATMGGGTATATKMITITP